LEDKLVYKSFVAAKLYYNVGQYKAAMVSLRNSLLDYPESMYREEILYLIAKSTYLRAANSIESKQKERYQKTVDEYYSFIAEFPESKYRKEMDGFFNIAQRSVK
jgi:outer membrane protein assembly factor BamD